MTVAIVIQTGFGCKADERSGLWTLVQSLRATYLNARIWFLAHDADVESIASEVASADWIAHVGHSFGVGHGLLRFAAALHAKNRTVNLSCAIDPVPDLLGRWMIKTEEPFPNFPQSIDEVFLARTLNQAGPFAPWGRNIDSPAVFERLIFSGDGGTGRVAFTTWIEDSSVHHDNIDDRAEVHGCILRIIAERIGA